MDDTNTNPKQQVPVQPIVQQSQPVVSGGTKEAPTGMPIKTEWVAPSTPEIVLPKEVKDAGVEVKSVVPQLSDSAKQQGVQMGHQNIPAPHVTVEGLGLQTPKGVLQQLHAAHKSVKDSLSWLVRLILKEKEKEEKHITSGYN